MKGLKLDFKDSGSVRIDFSSSVDDFDSTIQNAIVNSVTKKGSDSIYGKKGTNLTTDLLTGGLFTSNIYHVCNFSATSSLEFTNSNSLVDEKISTLKFEPSEKEGTLYLKVLSESTDRRTSNLTWAI